MNRFTKRVLYTHIDEAHLHRLWVSYWGETFCYARKASPQIFRVVGQSEAALYILELDECINASGNLTNHGAALPCIQHFVQLKLLNKTFIIPCLWGVGQFNRDSDQHISLRHHWSCTKSCEHYFNNIILLPVLLLIIISFIDTISASSISRIDWHSNNAYRCALYKNFKVLQQKSGLICNCWRNMKLPRQICNVEFLRNM